MNGEIFHIDMLYFHIFIYQLFISSLNCMRIQFFLRKSIEEFISTKSDKFIYDQLVAFFFIIFLILLSFKSQIGIFTIKNFYDYIFSSNWLCFNLLEFFLEIFSFSGWKIYSRKEITPRFLKNLVGIQFNQTNSKLWLKPSNIRRCIFIVINLLFSHSICLFFWILAWQNCN